MPVQRILLPVDYSSCSRAALSFALDLAQKYQAALDVVHVWDRPAYMTDAVMMSAEAVPAHSLFHLIEANAQRDLNEFLQGVRLPAGDALSGRLLDGDPASALLHELKRGKHDLVVVGTHGRTGLSHLMLGSVSEKLARLAPVPVVTVPDEAVQRLRA